MHASVTTEITDGVATIALDDGKANALSPTVQAGVVDGLDRAEAAGAIVVLRGRPGNFSGGFDLGVLRSGGAEAVEMVVGGFTLARRLLAFPRPVVIACDGNAMAMGAFLLLAVDHRIATARPSRFATNEVAIGMTMPHTAVLLMHHRLNPPQRERAMLLAETFDVAGALAAGFVDELVDPDGLDARLAELTGALGRLDARAHRASKLRSRAALLTALDAAIADDRAELEAIFLR